MESKRIVADDAAQEDADGEHAEDGYWIVPGDVNKEIFEKLLWRKHSLSSITYLAIFF